MAPWCAPMSAASVALRGLIMCGDRMCGASGGWARSPPGVVADDCDRAVAVVQDGLADRAEHRAQDVTSASGPDDEQGGTLGSGDEHVSGIAAHELGDDRDAGEFGPPTVEGALEGPAGLQLGLGWGTGSPLEIGGWVRGPGVHRGEADAALAGGL